MPAMVVVLADAIVGGVQCRVGGKAGAKGRPVYWNLIIFAGIGGMFSLLGDAHAER